MKGDAEGRGTGSDGGGVKGGEGTGGEAGVRYCGC